jgi:hypothetical protein
MRRDRRARCVEVWPTSLVVPKGLPHGADHPADVFAVQQHCTDPKPQLLPAAAHDPRRDQNQGSRKNAGRRTAKARYSPSDGTTNKTFDAEASRRTRKRQSNAPTAGPAANARSTGRIE